MITALTWLVSAYSLGLIVRLLGLPPLVGYLCAGFALSAYGYQSNEILAEVAHAGVLILLFTVGLKLKLGSLLRPEVFAGAIVHMVVSWGLIYLLLRYTLDLSAEANNFIAIALIFSSTVVAAKILEAKRELRAFHGRVVIGILIVQDLVAVAVLSVSGGSEITVWALGLLLLIPARPLIYKLLDISGHEELLVLYGMLLALVLGGSLFSALGLSSELGALLLGVLLSEHKRAQEMSQSLWSLKEILLVGFFLQIGLNSQPSFDAFLYAMLLLLLVPLKSLLFFFLLLRFRLRARSSFLASLSLATYSEFGLIIANMAVARGYLTVDWLASLAMAVALSFAIAAPLGRYAHNLFKFMESWLSRFESRHHHPDDRPISLGNADVVIIGMGRVGTGAYDFLLQQAYQIIGMDSDPVKVANHQQQNRNVIYADSEDSGLWQKIDLSKVKAVLLAMPDMEAKRFAICQLRQVGYQGVINATALFNEEVDVLKKLGADEVYNYYNGVGVGFAEYVIRDIQLENT